MRGEKGKRGSLLNAVLQLPIHDRGATKLHGYRDKRVKHVEVSRWFCCLQEVHFLWLSPLTLPSPR